LFGKVIAHSFINFGNYEKGSNFHNLTLYLDTNIIFSILGFHLDSYNKPVLEMINIFKSANISLKIFEFTLGEVLYKLEKYWDEYDNYSSSVPVDSIYYTLKLKGYSKSDIIHLIENIENELDSHGVGIDYNFDIESLKKDETSDLFSRLSSHKIGKPVVVIDHDASVISAIKILRGNRKTRILEKSKYIFVTADNALIYFSKKNTSPGLIPDVLPSGYITSIFWLKGIKDSGNIFTHEF
jgi:hypothetical protein